MLAHCSSAGPCAGGCGVIGGGVACVCGGVSCSVLHCDWSVLADSVGDDKDLLI